MHSATVTPVGGTGPQSRSQHVMVRPAPQRLRSAHAAPPARPSPPAASADPPKRRATAEGVGTQIDPQKSTTATATRAASASRPRPAEAAAGGSGGGGGAALSSHAGHDVAYLYQQLQDALQQQARVEEERQRQLVQYRRQLRAICDENATLRSIIQAGETRKREAAAVLSRHATSTGTPSGNGGGTRKGPATVTEAELDGVEQRIHLARQRHNRLVHDVQVNTAALAKEQHACAALVEEAEAPLDPALLLMGANRPVYLRMIRLEHILNEVLRKQSTVGVVLKNYRYHLKTLREEATQYDVQQSMLENEYADRHRDHLQLLELHDTASAAYDDLVLTRTQVQQSGEKMRAAKEKALQQKRREVEKELADTQQQERRAVDLQQQLEEETQLLEAAENTKTQLEQQRLNSRTALTLLKATSPAREASTAAGRSSSAAALAGTDEHADERISAFEAAFHDMMNVAHADTLDHLVDVYQAEMAQQCKLQDDLDELRETRTTLQQEAQMLRERLRQTKYCVGAGTRFTAGPGAGPAEGAATNVNSAGSPLMEREMITFLREEQEALSTQISENEQNQSLLLEVAERMNRLAVLVGEYRSDVRLPAIRLSPALSKRSSTLPLHSAVLTQKLLALASDAAATPPQQQQLPYGEGNNSSSSSNNNNNNTRSIPVVSSTQLVIPANNRRVPLAHERHGEGNGDNNGGVGRGGAGGRRTRFSADVAGISSGAARALLNAADNPLASSSGVSPDNAAARGAAAVFKHLRKRRSSASAGAGFIERRGDEGEEDGDDDAQLALVAALPPPGGRVLDFDVDTSDSSDDGVDGGGGGGGSDGSSEPPFSGHAAEADMEGSPNTSAISDAALRRRRSSAKAGAGGRLNAPGRGAISGSGGAAVVEDDQEDPLRRDEVKKMSVMIQERRKRDLEEKEGAAASS